MNLHRYRKRGVKTVTSEELFSGGDALLIYHADVWYLLRKAPRGGLLLTRWTGDQPIFTTQPRRGPGQQAAEEERRHVRLMRQVWLED